jgi:hypothetical protein
MPTHRGTPRVGNLKLPGNHSWTNRFLPEPESRICRDPVEGRAHVGDDELNGLPPQSFDDLVHADVADSDR